MCWHLDCSQEMQHRSLSALEGDINPTPSTGGALGLPTRLPPDGMTNGNLTAVCGVRTAHTATTKSGTLTARVADVPIDSRLLCAALMLTGVSLVATLHATMPDAADHSIRRFLEQDDTQHPYRATRRLEATNGGRSGRLEALTEYSRETGFRYEVTDEAGSGSITKALRAVLAAEHDMIAQGQSARSSIDRANYTFEPDGIDEEGLANILLSPRRKERELVAGRMFLAPDEGRLVRLHGQLAKNPSFWITNVEVLWSYDRIDGAVVPVSLTSNARVRFLGAATMRMTYHYSEIDGRTVSR
jgi:hypothetical protein